MTAAIIIAKGHSTRLPRKNLLEFCGKPLFVWSVIQAKCSHLIDQVYVSTDHDQIEKLAKQHGAHVIRRPTLHPDITAGPIYCHAVNAIRQQTDFDRMVAILPTSPLKHPYDLDESIRLYERMPGDLKIVVSLTPECETVVYKKTGPRTFEPVIGDKKWNYMTQGGAWNVMSPEQYVKNSSHGGTVYDSEIDIDFKATLKRAKNNPDVPTYYYPLQEYQQFDIDNFNDFEICEAIMERLILTAPDVYERYAADDLIGKHLGGADA